MTPQLILTIFLSFITIEYFWGLYLGFRDDKSMKQAIPNQLKDVYKEDEYQKSLNYHRTLGKFGFVSDLFSTLSYLAVIYFGILGKYNDYIGNSFSDNIVVALLFFGSIALISDIVQLPFSLYSTFVIEEKFGFNKTTVKTFFLDKLKGYFLMILIGAPLLYLLFFLINTLGQNFWIYFWAVITVFMLLMNVFYTSLIVPLFNKLSPMEDGELKSAIEAYCKKVDFPLTNLFVIDGSKRSTKANAYFSGMGRKKKIVLFDTLIENHTTDELVAVLAHEVGHYKRKHVYQGLILGVLQTGLTLFILSWFINNENLSQALGATNNQIHLNLIAFSMLFSPISSITGLFMNLLSRKNEYEADNFAVTTFGSTPLISALKKLSANNFSNLTPDKLIVFLGYSHPPILNRILAMEKTDKNG